MGKKLIYFGFHSQSLLDNIHLRTLKVITNFCQ